MVWNCEIMPNFMSGFQIWHKNLNKQNHNLRGNSEPKIQIVFVATLFPTQATQVTILNSHTMAE